MSSNLTNDVWCCQIDGLFHWLSGGGGWLKYLQAGPRELQLRIYPDVIIITNFDKVVESLNATTMKMKGFLKGQVIILAISDKHKAIRKIKFQLVCSPEMTAQCVGYMAAFFPVEDRNTKQFINRRTLQFRTVEQTLKHILEGGITEVVHQMPAQYPEFVRLCLLDPAFTQLVLETENVLKDILKP